MTHTYMGFFIMLVLFLIATIALFYYLYKGFAADTMTYDESYIWRYRFASDYAHQDHTFEAHTNLDHPYRDQTQQQRTNYPNQDQPSHPL